MGKPVSPAAQSPGPGGWSPLYLRSRCRFRRLWWERGVAGVYGAW
jgi:hypothetical protein